MTVHVAISGGNSAVLVSDSQASTSFSKRAGAQKQYCGDQFIIGAAGNGGIAGALFEHLSTHHFGASGTNVLSDIAAFMASQIAASARDSIELVALLLSPEPSIHFLNPSVFTGFRPAGQLYATGSGAEFVDNAATCGVSGWMGRRANTLAQQVVQGVHFADAADQSISCNDMLTIGFIANGRAYFAVDPDFRPQYVHPLLEAQWNMLTQLSGEIIDQARAINSEMTVASEAFGHVWSGTLTMSELGLIGTQNAEIARQTSELATRLGDYQASFDGVLGR
ncbi:MAG: hypothetical protein SH850_06065 [Planctomycetaceae bacterium]|nr:hypothetical protein [Planctomycetaceae bacterium]